MIRHPHYHVSLYFLSRLAIGTVSLFSVSALGTTRPEAIHSASLNTKKMILNQTSDFNRRHSLLLVGPQYSRSYLIRAETGRNLFRTGFQSGDYRDMAWKPATDEMIVQIRQLIDNHPLPPVHKAQIRRIVDIDWASHHDRIDAQRQWVDEWSHVVAFQQGLREEEAATQDAAELNRSLERELRTINKRINTEIKTIKQRAEEAKVLLFEQTKPADRGDDFERQLQTINDERDFEIEFAEEARRILRVRLLSGSHQRVSPQMMATPETEEAMTEAAMQGMHAASRVETAVLEGKAVTDHEDNPIRPFEHVVRARLAVGSRYTDIVLTEDAMGLYTITPDEYVIGHEWYFLPTGHAIGLPGTADTNGGFDAVLTRQIRGIATQTTVTEGSREGLHEAIYDDEGNPDPLLVLAGPQLVVEDGLHFLVDDRGSPLPITNTVDEMAVPNFTALLEAPTINDLLGAMDMVLVRAGGDTIFRELF